MSALALIWAANVKGLKPAAKIVLIQLADFHNRETGQCNSGATRLADDCEMGRAPLFRHMTRLEKFSLVTRTFLQQNKSWLTISPWLITGTFSTGIVSMMAASLLWTLMLASSELTDLGLTRIDRQDGTWLVLDPTKTRLRTCTLGGRSVTCIKIEEN